jgi:diphosphomevalonate decarboxylase
MSESVAVARSNIALTKYWGKRDAERNTPATPSVSLTLAGLETRTRVRLDPALASDRVVLDGADADPAEAARVTALLDLVRARALVSTHAAVDSASTFPAGAGLASSASAFAALAAAGARAYGLTLDTASLSALALRGSASAARSVYGGFAELRAGASSARPVEDAEGWDVRMVVVRCGEGRKTIASRDAMVRTAATSPYYRAWVATAGDLHARAMAAIRARDLAALGEAMERSCVAMHAAALAASPPIFYWTAATLEAMAAVRALREHGVTAFFTIDAGPHVKVLCAAADAQRVARTFGDRSSVHAPGAGVEAS